MRKVLAVFFVLAIAALAAFTSVPPKPRTAVSVRAAGTIVWVKYTVTASGSPDSVVVLTSASGQPTVRRRYTVSTKTDSVPFPRPAVSLTISGDVAPTSWRRGLSAAGTPAPWSYTEPDVPPPSPVVGPVEVIPASATFTPSQVITVTIRG